VREHAVTGATFVFLVSALAAGCGGSPSAENGNTGKPNDTATRALEKMDAQLEGLGGKERRAELVKLADKEGGSVDAYGSTNLDETIPFIEAFEDATGIDVNYYRANSEDVLGRVVEESKANFKGADVVFTNGPELRSSSARACSPPSTRRHGKRESRPHTRS
jgi:iron(III) transport system substrate-binding protein